MTPMLVTFKGDLILDLKQNKDLIQNESSELFTNK